MKKLLLTLLALVTLNLMVGQTNVKLQIVQKLGSDSFAFNQTAKNNMDNTFNVSRLEYYLSGFEIIHDGNTVTSLPDAIFLIDANQGFLVDLGAVSFTQLEGISFHVGVGAADNHGDPSAYSAGHPLAPKSPSMHWGWASGYRFVAIEGKGGISLNRTYELHGLGDKNYLKTEILTSGIAAGNDVVISLTADYTRVLENIKVDNGTLIHGEDGDAQTALYNFKNYVFSSSSSNTAIDDLNDLSVFQVYPNPSLSNDARVSFGNANHKGYEIIITDLPGRIVSENKVPAGQEVQKISVSQAGMYLIHISENGRRVSTRKWLVN